MVRIFGMLNMEGAFISVAGMYLTGGFQLDA
jgi:hypothetical protein